MKSLKFYFVLKTQQLLNLRLGTIIESQLSAALTFTLTQDFFLEAEQTNMYICVFHLFTLTKQAPKNNNRSKGKYFEKENR